MSSFVDVVLSEIGKTITGKTPSSKSPEDFGEDFMFVTPSDDWTNKFISKTNRFVSKIGLRKLNNKSIPSKSVLVSCIGSAMGKVMMNNSRCLTNQQINSIIVDDSKYSSDYIYYQLTNNYKILRNAATGSTSLPLLNKTDFDQIKLKVHQNLLIQEQIAKVLSDLDAKIEVNNKINQALEAMAKTLYDYWFVQFDFPDANGKPYKSSGGKMVFNKVLKREIPEGWSVKKVINELNVQYGFPFSTKLFNDENKGFPVIRIRDIIDNSISLYSTENTDEKYKLEKGDLLIGMDGNFHMNFWDKNNCYLNQRCVRIRQKNEKSPSTFQTLFDTQPHIKAREKNVSRTTVGHLSARDINDLNVLIPNEEVRIKSNKKFNSLLKKIIINRNENQKLAELRDWLLPMLMNGQVTVGEAEQSVNEELAMVAEDGLVYKKEKDTIDTIFSSINYDYEVAVITYLTYQKFGFGYGKKYIHKMFSNIELLSSIPQFSDLVFEEKGWGMFCPAIAKTIENQKFINFEDINNGLTVVSFNYKYRKELKKWMQQDAYSKDFVANVKNMLTIYEKPLIVKNMDRIELLNTVLECIKVLNTYSFDKIWYKMEHWKMYEGNYKTKADKFNPNETQLMIDLIKELN